MSTTVSPAGVCTIYYLSGMEETSREPMPPSSTSNLTTSNLATLETGLLFPEHESIPDPPSHPATKTRAAGKIADKKGKQMKQKAVKGKGKGKAVEKAVEDDVLDISSDEVPSKKKKAALQKHLNRPMCGIRFRPRGRQ